MTVTLLTIINKNCALQQNLVFNLVLLYKFKKMIVMARCHKKKKKKLYENVYRLLEPLKWMGEP